MQTYSKQEITILLAEDDDGHAELILDNLREAGLRNTILRFADGQEVLNFLQGTPGSPALQTNGAAYLLLLDIRMPKVDGVEVLRRLKNDPALQTLPVVMLTTTDDPCEVKHCYELGCNCYITKPVDYERFAEMLQRLGLFLTIVQIPELQHEHTKGTYYPCAE